MCANHQISYGKWRAKPYVHIYLALRGCPMAPWRTFKLIYPTENWHFLWLPDLIAIFSFCPPNPYISEEISPLHFNSHRAGFHMQSCGAMTLNVTPNHSSADRIHGDAFWFCPLTPRFLSSPHFFFWWLGHHPYRWALKRRSRRNNNYCECNF